MSITSLLLHGLPARFSGSYFLVLVLVCLPIPQRVGAQEVSPSGQTIALSLAEAVARALSQSEEVGLARSQVDLADTRVKSAFSALYPQVNGTAGYTRTIQSVFDTGSFIIPDSLRFDPDPAAPLEERIRYLEENAPNAALAGFGDLFNDLPFGQENVYVAMVSGSQVLFAPQERVGVSIARHFRQAAAYNFTEEQAGIRLQVEEAYIQTQLARELVTSSEAAIAQALAFLDEERLRLRAGRASELEVLRAEVNLENLRPQLVEAQNAAEVAVLNLKRLANIPYRRPVELTTPLALPLPDQLADPELDPEAIVSARALIQAAEEQVEIRRAQVRLERAGFLPRVALNASYGRQRFAEDLVDFGGNWRPDFTVGLGMQVSIFNGFQRQAAVQQAQVELERSQYQLNQLREAVALQIEQALGEKRRARSLIAARQRTVEQAERVYRLTALQYDEGVSTQLEVSEARLALLQARSNLAQALADFYLADATLVRAQAGMGNAQPTVRQTKTP